MSKRTIWLGRVWDRGSLHVVRVATDGAPPGPDDRVEEIPDPFDRAIDDVWSYATSVSRVANGLSAPLGMLTIAPPVLPRKIIAVGRNFRAHAAEFGNEVPEEPLLFLKPSTCLLASQASLSLPRGYDRIDMEAELVVVIGRSSKRLDRARALESVAGYTLGNDISNRDLQKRDKQWTRAKGFDGFGPVGPFIRLFAPGTELAWSELRLRGYIDDVCRQDAALSDMVFGVRDVLAYVSEGMTLEVGDLVFMGTPEGVSPLSPGSITRVEIVRDEQPMFGRLINPVF